MAVDIRLARAREEEKIKPPENIHTIVTPGDVVTTDTGFMRGHGTFMEEGKLFAAVAGVVERVNKLVCVKPLKSRYNGEVGDVVVGRVVEVGQKRWRVDTNSRLNSVLMLSAVNLPGGELRRRSEEDEKMMRQYLKEGDLISAEVQNVMADGTLGLHTRSLKYGKLGQGVLVRVSPSLIKRRKTHFHNMPGDASVILGNNGYIWISPTSHEEEENTGGYVQDFEPLSRPVREAISRLRNCVLALAHSRMLLYDTSLQYAFLASERFEVKDLLKQEVQTEVMDITRQKLEMLTT